MSDHSDAVSDAPETASSGATSRGEKIKRAQGSAPRTPNPSSLAIAANLGTHRQANCNIRKVFARRDNLADPVPMLARLVGGPAGRSAEVRLKLVLTLLFLAREGDPWTVEKIPAASWALLFGLHDPERSGAARVNKAIKGLAAADLIVADQRRGREPRLLVVHEAGDGRPWTSPVGQPHETLPEEDRYAQLDRGFWANGWIGVLSSRAVAALVILLDATWLQRGTDKVPVTARDERVFEQVKSLPWWHLPEQQLVERYAISRDTFDRGIKELLAWEVVEDRKRQAVDRSTWGERRWYRELRVRLEVLQAPVVEAWTGAPIARVAPSTEDSFDLLTAWALAD